MSYMDCCNWDACTLCGQCLMECPVMSMEKQEAVAEMRGLLAGDPAPRVFSECTLCFNCNQYCPEGLRPHELILQRVLSARKRPVPALLPYFMTGMPGPNFFADLYAALSPEEKAVLSKWAQPPEKSKEILWVGCIGRVSCRDLENSRVLASLPKYGPTDLCCGELHYRAGSWDAFSDRVEKTLARFAELDTGRLVCYCGSCYNFLAKILPKVHGTTLPFEVVSLYQWLWERVEQGKLTVQRPLDFTAAVHESCYVTELGQEFPLILRKLYQAAGARLVELPHSGIHNLSCGAVSVARDMNVFKSLIPAQRKKFADAKAAGVRDLALNCPGCFLTLSLASRLYGVRLRYMPDLLLAAFGDDVTRPLAGRMGLVLKTAARRWPLFFKKAAPDLLA